VRTRRGPAPRAGARLAVTALAVALAFTPSRAAGQVFQGSAGSFAVQRRFAYRGEVTEQAAVFYGGGGSVLVGSVRLGVSGLVGSLPADTLAPVSVVRVRTTAVTLQVAVSHDIQLGVRAEGRRFASDAGVAFWKLVGPNVRFEPEFGLSGLRGLVDVGLLTSSSVRGGAKMSSAVQTTLGATYSPPGTPLQIALAYRFERYDIEATRVSAVRLEQFRGLVIEAGVHLGRW
jgi:hypothetical protein